MQAKYMYSTMCMFIVTIRYRPQYIELIVSCYFCTGFDCFVRKPKQIEFVPSNFYKIKWEVLSHGPNSRTVSLPLAPVHFLCAFLHGFRAGTRCLSSGKMREMLMSDCLTKLYVELLLKKYWY